MEAGVANDFWVTVANRGTGGEFGHDLDFQCVIDWEGMCFLIHEKSIFYYCCYKIMSHFVTGHSQP